MHIHLNLASMGIQFSSLQFSCKDGLMWIGTLYVAINILQIGQNENVQHDYHSEELIIVDLTCLPP